MSIRQHHKDHKSSISAQIGKIGAEVRPDNSKVGDGVDGFWTSHPSPCFVDLAVFRDGEDQPSRPGGTWSGPFSGRPQLIAELAPAIQALTDNLAPDSVTNYIMSLRSWWRLFDSVETIAVTAAGSTFAVTAAEDITDIHRQRARDIGMSAMYFRSFVRIVNLTLQANKQPQLHWTAPKVRGRKRHLPPEWQTDAIRFALKRAWFAALHRWERKDLLLNGHPPGDPEAARLRKNYRRFRYVTTAINHPTPTMAALIGNVSSGTSFRRGYKTSDMYRGFYPDAYDIRIAFHLCLANTGWNPAMLLRLDVENSLIEPHPKDPTRYMLRGQKHRGQYSEHVVEGLFKSQGSPGIILQTLVARTEPLRAELRGRLTHLKEQYENLRAVGASPVVLRSRLNEILKLERGVRSPWLYVTAKGKAPIQWLRSDEDCSRGLVREVAGGFLGELIDSINRKQPASRLLSPLRASDFRDAFAGYAYRVSGGMVLYVMRVLRHKQLKTTQGYLDNTLHNAESQALYRTFSHAMWDEIEANGRVDPTIIAKRSRDGGVTDEQRHRLDIYRSMRRSRIGVGCKDPWNPPKHIAPEFEPNGLTMCTVQRCTLCPENAVIFPDSLTGLCKRMAELRSLKTNMSVAAYLESSFGEEMKNTELALKYFDDREVRTLIADWETRILNGTHRVAEIDGGSGVTR